MIKHFINIENPDYYQNDDNDERTQKRLTEIADAKMSEVNYGQFGYEGAFSGLYIEKVWNYSDSDFDDYMEWALSKINEYKYTTLKTNVEELIDVYERRINTITSMIDALEFEPTNDVRIIDEERNRLKIKVGVYRSFFHELKRIL